MVVKMYSTYVLSLLVGVIMYKENIYSECFQDIDTYKNDKFIFGLLKNSTFYWFLNKKLVSRQQF